MSLNPIQFGKDVLDQYGRYLLTTFRLADPDLAAQLREALAYRPGTAERLAKGPYIYLNRPFVQGPGIRDLIADRDLGFHAGLEGLFPFGTLHKHQERSLRAAVAGKHVLMATGTGSGKTEGFLLPILDYCLKLRDEGAPPGVAAVLIYPMNALVNDQLERLRELLAGSRITFGRYTGETPERAEGVRQLEEPREYTAAERHRAAERLEELPLPWEECTSRAAIRKRRPRLLLTNYSQLEYLLLRDRDVALFRDAPLRFFVLDEVHTYTGALGSEVACLLRRLRSVAGKAPEEVVSIGSSATVVDPESGGGTDLALREFAARLFGVPREEVELIQEEHQRYQPAPGERYIPPVPDDPEALLEEILAAVRESVLADEVDGVPEQAVELAGRLCGRSAPAEGASLERLHALLAPNRLVDLLQESFTRPATLEVVLPQVRRLGERRQAAEAALQAEVLAYLTLGALARRDDEPLMRPKLHYFVQGLHGLQVSWPGGRFGQRPALKVSDGGEDEVRSFPLSFCRACGQHFILAAAGEPQAVDDGGAVRGVRSLTTASSRTELKEEGGELCYLTDRLFTGDSDEEVVRGAVHYLCRYCGSLHDAAFGACLAPKCRREGAPVEVQLFAYPETRCPACQARSTERSPVITTVRSSEVYDIMILAQTQLACMPEPALRKVLAFADSRQDAAFQAGWMESRSLRFRVRHLAYQLLAEDPERWWYFEELVAAVAERGVAEGIVPAKGARREPAIQRLRWLLIEELFAATERQRRNSLEQLGLAQLRYEGVTAEGVMPLAERWAGELQADAQGLAAVVSLILDVFRLRHAVSHPLLGRSWREWDKEVRDGIVQAPEYFRPQLVVPESGEDKQQRRYLIAVRSSRWSTAVERFLSKSFADVERDRLAAFLDELWSWLVHQQLLVPRRLKEKRFGKLEDLAGIEGGFQVNLDLIQVAHAVERYVCNHCGTARARRAPGNACPAYNCTGSLHLEPRDEDHYDVVQYSRFDFVPLLAREHSAQVPQDDRLKIEAAFKRPEGRVNCLVATPTLELGVDIGPLELVLMRNVPPSPASYAQRAGRAGRRHRIGAIFTYCRNVQHDQYFYRDPPAMISGDVRIPAFSMRNAPLLARHVRSTLLTALRTLPDPEAALDEAFPRYISEYFGDRAEGRRRFRSDRPGFEALERLLAAHQEELAALLTRTFIEQWPEEERDVVVEVLGEQLQAAAGELRRAVGTLYAEIGAYQTLLAEFRQVGAGGDMLEEDDLRRRNNYERALRQLWSEDQANYSLTWLARRGFFPGYALVQENVRAQCLAPPLDVSRNLPMAVRELTPAARLYANRRQFKVRRLDFYLLKASQPDFEPSQLEQVMVYDEAHERVVTAGAGREGGEAPGVAFTSLELIDVELEGLGEISDQAEYRFRVGYRQHSLRLPEHRGGRGGRVGLVPYQLLNAGHLRLVNLGPRQHGPAVPESGIGFPLCAVCGETRSPFASEREIESFGEHHGKRCGRGTGSAVGWYALHVDVSSDLLLLGPFEHDAGAINALEAVRIGARQVLEMGDQELEVELLKNEDGSRTVGVLFDPLPGGSGLLPLVMEYWEPVLDAAKDVLSRCDCDTACYRCLLHFRNQQHHASLDRHLAINALGECQGDFHHEYEIPSHFTPREAERSKTDSPKEEQLLDILQRRGFPLPSATQHRVDLGGGSFTVADFAWPEHKLLLYIDGLSHRIHGNEEQRRKDRRLTTKAELAGWRVRRFSAEGLSDETMLADYLDELAMLLGVG